MILEREEDRSTPVTRYRLTIGATLNFVISSWTLHFELRKYSRIKQVRKVQRSARLDGATSQARVISVYFCRETRGTKLWVVFRINIAPVVIRQLDWLLKWIRTLFFR